MSQKINDGLTKAQRYYRRHRAESAARARRDKAKRALGRKRRAAVARAARLAAQQPSRLKECRECVGTFLVKPSHWDKAAYCSRECMARGLSKRLSGMGRRLRKDNNHTEIVAVLRKLGWSVVDLSTLGQGVPDLVIGDASHGAHMVEVKNRHTSYGRSGLSKRQVRWRDSWKGIVHIVRTIDDALALTRQLTGGRERGDGGPIPVTTVKSAADALERLG